ncbi:hypothetical protein D9758_006675 [Tetrapyrgos nigripes]|uniref:Uncharacterized protein n=1 Tax=Tetrapyrgos nigripes TaxID=182062 RepID=A0A8H5GJE4_9AGAR|nr:hypothetical protein D9758_006675 [Tetrapyrgos nigripes]
MDYFQVDVFQPIATPLQSPDPPLFIPPPFHNDTACQCTCGLCCCKSRVLSPPTPRAPPTPTVHLQDDVDAETIGPLSTTGGPSTVGIGPHVTNIDPFNFKSPSIPPTELSDDLNLVGLPPSGLSSPPPIPIPVHIDPIGDPAFAATATATPIQSSPNPNPFIPMPIPMPMSPVDSIHMSMLSPDFIPPLPTTPPPPPRPDFNTTLMDPPDFPPVHRKTMQVIMRIKPVFVDCLDELYDLLRKLDALPSPSPLPSSPNLNVFPSPFPNSFPPSPHSPAPMSPSPSAHSNQSHHTHHSNQTTQSKQAICMDLEDIITNLWFVLPPRHSCDDTLDCRHWHQRFIERMEQVAEKLVSFLDELRNPPELSKFSFRMDQYHRVLENNITPSSRLASNHETTGLWDTVMGYGVDMALWTGMRLWDIMRLGMKIETKTTEL